VELAPDVAAALMDDFIQLLGHLPDNKLWFGPTDRVTSQAAAWELFSSALIGGE